MTFHSVWLPELPCEYSVAGQLPVVSLSVRPAGNPLRPPLPSGHLLGLEVLELCDHSLNGRHSTFQFLLLLCLILKKKKRKFSIQADFFRAHTNPLNPFSTLFLAKIRNLQISSISFAPNGTSIFQGQHLNLYNSQ